MHPNIRYYWILKTWYVCWLYVVSKYRKQNAWEKRDGVVWERGNPFSLRVVEWLQHKIEWRGPNRRVMSQWSPEGNCIGILGTLDIFWRELKAVGRMSLKQIPAKMWAVCLPRTREYFLFNTLLTVWSRVVLEKHVDPPHLMKPEGSLPCSQEPATCPYP
jgi:hypothetical protein